MAGLKRKSDKIDLLGRVSLFSNLSKTQLGLVARAAEEVQIRSGDLIAIQGRPGDEAYVVVSGSVVVRRNGRKVAALQPGDVAGEMSLIDGEPRSADLIAAEDGSILVMTRRDFRGLLDSVPGLTSKVMLSLTQRLRQADKRLYG